MKTEMCEPLNGAHELRVRTITHFLSNFHDSEEGWDEAFTASSQFLNDAKISFESKGLQVQTVRIATRVLSQVQCPNEALKLALALEALALHRGISFLSLGSTCGNSDMFLSEKGFLSKLAGSLHNTSFTVSWQNAWGLKEAKLLSTEIFNMTRGPVDGANFRFAISFNCPSGIPYFPAASSGDHKGFALGTENSGLLYAAMQVGSESDPGNLETLQKSISAAFTAALTPLEQLSLDLETVHNIPYLGIDASVAPALEPPTITSAFAAVGLGEFGQSGTLAICERITAALKSLPLRLCGYCGLMLPVCEDAGLAAAAASGSISLQNLLEFSAVCGVGLDTVPIAGPGVDATAEERDALVLRTAALLLDTAALSRRLNKPLTARLLPVTGAHPGQVTQYCNPYLVESAVMGV